MRAIDSAFHRSATTEETPMQYASAVPTMLLASFVSVPAFAHGTEVHGSIKRVVSAERRVL